jgi:hypothetical protein
MVADASERNDQGAGDLARLHQRYLQSRPIAGANKKVVHRRRGQLAQIADRGLHPVERETYSNGVRKITYRDTDGNEIGFGGAPL